jgi:hypothetical protein
LWVQFILWWELWSWNFVHTYWSGGFTTNFDPIWFFVWPPEGRHQKYY